MNTRLCVADIAPILSQYSGPDFMSRLNRVLDRYNSSGLWKGIASESLHSMGTDGRGFITLARHEEAIIGVAFCNRPALVMNQWTSYNPVSLGYVPEDQRGCGPMTDMGDGFCTFANISEAATLRLKISDAADAGKTVRLNGKDENGQAIFDSIGFEGLNLTTANPSADTTQQFTVITGIQFPFMVGYSSLWQVVAGVETQIGTYAPGELRPCYRRYKTGIIDDNVAIRLFCRRRFIPLVAPTDWVIPGNLGALQFGLQALVSEDAGRYDQSRAAWAEGERLLNEDLSALRGSAITTLRIMGNETLQAGYGYGGFGGYGGNYVN
jgi:hypothetical protein